MVLGEGELVGAGNLLDRRPAGDTHGVGRAKRIEVEAGPVADRARVDLDLWASRHAIELNELPDQTIARSAS